MSDYNISSKITQLKNALSSLNKDEFDSSKFKGDALSIFDSLNEEYDNSFSDTGMKDILMSIAGDDGQISDEELNQFMMTDGVESLSASDFEKYAVNLLNDEKNNLDVNKSESSKKSNNVNNVNNFSKTLNDGSVLNITYNSDRSINRQDKKCPDGSSLSIEYTYDENGNKTGSVTKRYDTEGNLLNTTNVKYDLDGNKIYGKTVDADGTLVGEANYKYQKNADGTTSQLRYNMSGILTNTVVYKDNINEPISNTNNITNSVELFSKTSDGTMTSSVKSVKGNTLEENIFDKNGNISFKTVYNEFGEKIAEITYTYYDNGALKNENRKDFKVPKHESTDLNNVNNANNVDNSKNIQSEKSSKKFSLGLTGEQLAEIARNVGGAEGTKDWCLRGVNDSLEVAYGFRFSYPSAYQALDGIRAKEGFEEITGNYPNAENLRNLPAGAIVIWDKCDQYPHGHISIALGDGTEASDCIRNQITRLGTSSYHVFMPT